MLKFNNKSISSVYDETTSIAKIMKGTLKVYDGWKKLIASGVPPITLQKCKGANLVDYKIYGDSVQNGTPTYATPIESESVGEKTKNLFNVKEYFTDYVNDENGITYTNIDFTSVSKKILTGQFKENTRYTMSLDFEVTNSNNNGFAVNMYNSNNTRIVASYQNTITGDKSGRIVLTNPSDTTISYILISYNTSQRTCNVKLKNIQIEENTTATAFEPYGYKIPVMVNSENILDLSQLPSTSVYRYGDYGIKQIKTQYTNGGFKFPVNIPAGSQLYISYKYVESFGNASDSKAVYLRAHTSSGNRKNILLRSNHIDGKFYVYACDVLVEDIVQLEFYTMNTWEVGSYYIIDNVKITYEKPITTNIYLNEPLRKIGDYADYIDFEKQQVIRKIYNEFITKVDSKSSTSSTYSMFLSEISKNPLLEDDTGYCISNKFQKALYRYVQTPRYPNIIQTYLTTSRARRVVYTFDDTSINTVALAKEKIGDGFDICYVLEKEIVENIELPNILLNKGINRIEVDTNILPSNIEIKYYGRTNILLLNEEENIILNSILADDTETDKDITDTEIIQILDEIIGG